MKFLKALCVLVGVSASVLAAPTSGPAGNFITNVSTNVSVQIFNVSSGTISTQLNLPYITAGQCTTVLSSGKVVGIPCGSGTANIAVTSGIASGFSSVTSSPTAVINFDSSTFTTVLKGGATVYVALLNSYLTTSSATTTYLQQSSATTTYLQQSSATATYLQQSSATATYFPLTGILSVAHGGTGTSSPGLIAGTNILSITGSWPNQTINASGSGGGGGVGGAFVSWYLVDGSSGKWQVTVDLTGHLTTASVSSVPSGALAPHTLVTQDKNFVLWTIGIDTGGHLTTASAGSTAQSITDLLMNDSTSITWLITIDTTGHLVTS